MSNPIATDGLAWVCTIAWACIATDGISIVTEFVTGLTRGDVGPDDSIPASGAETVVGAGICVDVVGIITCFVTRKTWVKDVTSPDTIATCGLDAGIGAGIEVVVVAVVASFTGGLNAIAASRERAVAVAS